MFQENTKATKMKKNKKPKKSKILYMYISNNLSKIKENPHLKIVNLESEKCLCLTAYFPIFSECFYNKGDINLKFLHYETSKLVENYISYYIKINRKK